MTEHLNLASKRLSSPAAPTGLGDSFNPSLPQQNGSSSPASQSLLLSAENIVDTVREPLLVLDADLRVMKANLSFYRTFRVEPEGTLGQLIYGLGNKQWDIPRLRKLLEEVWPEKTSFHDFEVDHFFPTIGHKFMVLNARRILQEDNQTKYILLAIEDVTERRHAEEKRQKIETRFTSLVKNIKDHAIVTMDPEGRFTSWNVEAEHILGYPEAEILDQLFPIIFTPEDIRDGIPELELRTAKEDGRAVNERWHIRKGGEMFWALGIVTPTYDASGEHTGFSKILRDMTEQKLAEEELIRSHEKSETQVQEQTAALRTAKHGLQKEIAERRRTEEEARRVSELLHAVADGTPDLVFVKDRMGRYLLFNNAAVQFVGKRVEEALGQDDTALFSPAEARLVMDQDHRVMESGQVEIVEEVLTAGGATRTFLSTKAPYRNSAGNVIGVLGIAHDLSVRKRVEAERNELLARLNLQIERLPLAYLLSGSDFRYTRWNPAAERTFGFAEAEVLGKHPFEVIVSPQLQPFVGEIFERLKAGDMNAHGVCENVTKDGRTITCEWFNTPLFEDDGRFAGILCLAQDVTERRALEEQFRQAQKMEAFGQLAGGVAHDFNNLLTIISGYSELMLETLKPEDRNRELLQEIHKAGERAALLTRQLLTFSRKQVVQPQILDLNGLVAGTERMLVRLIGEDVNLTTVLAPGLDRVKVDPGQVEQVIMNLVVNARDAMPQGGRITIETANVDLDESYGQSHTEVKPGRYVLLAVSDTGQGMPEEVKSHIFEPFFTTKEVGKGTGLGLATVFGIVKQSGGHVSVYSEVSHGATFKIYLPAVEADASPNQTEAKLASPLTGAETILLVEDEKAVRSITRLALQASGYTLLEAANGAEAIGICENYRGPIHLLVSDVVMPQMGGRQLAERLSALHPETRVLFVSGYTDDAVIRHGVLQAGVAFLQKPFSIEALHRKVRDVLDAKE